MGGTSRKCSPEAEHVEDKEDMGEQQVPPGEGENVPSPKGPFVPPSLLPLSAHTWPFSLLPKGCLPLTHGMPSGSPTLITG